MKKEYKDEYVLVFPVSLLIDLGYFNGITFLTGHYLEKILDREKYEFMNRNRAETDTGFKQLIPYVILCWENKVFSYRRGKLMSEKRLQGNYSIGVGGHIAVTDPGLFGTTYKEGMKRELFEEVNISSDFSERRAALINDDSNDVGKVHFGVVHIITLNNPEVVPREKSINEAGFVTVDSLKNNISKYETWSQQCIAVIDKLM